MTLKEKFKDVLINPIWQMTMIDKQIEITDEFAIGFAEWKDKFIDEVADWKQDGVYLKNRFSTEELLEIYKKEKGL
jgi:hypothetical protein